MTYEELEKKLDEEIKFLSINPDCINMYWLQPKWVTNNHGISYLFMYLTPSGKKFYPSVQRGAIIEKSCGCVSQLTQGSRSSHSELTDYCLEYIFNQAKNGLDFPKQGDQIRVEHLEHFKTLQLYAHQFYVERRLR